MGIGMFDLGAWLRAAKCEMWDWGCVVWDIECRTWYVCGM